ncbi:response regulator [Desulfobacter curvatus]|uniref:response regulator n=1 Tax=Desulfobacter curvatus TaxID=2290 RepID=UPI000368CD44|nr:response regulator [Desulfobacter curvatus]
MDDKIMIVDDDIKLLKSVERIFKQEPVKCFLFSSPANALKEAPEIEPTVVVSDLRMPEMEGTFFLEKMKQMLPATVRVLMTGYADIDATISAINQGQVFRFIKKPWDSHIFRSEIRHAVQYSKMLRRLVHSDAEPGESERTERLTGALEMAGAVCHEFAQPVQIISGYCEILTEELNRQPGVSGFKEPVSHILQSTERLKELLLKCMKVQRYKTRPYLLSSRIIDIDAATTE